MTPADILEEASERVRNGGWGKGSYGDATSLDVPHCTVGWLHAVCHAHEEPWTVASRARMAIEKTLNLGELGSVEGWNDEVAKSADEVGDVMMKAAKMLRNEGEIV